MAKDAKTIIYKVKMGSFFFAFRAPADADKGLESGLGVIKAKDTDDNLALGSANKPPRVRVNLANGKSYLRFCDPGKLESLITKGTLNGKKYDGQNINSVRAVQG